MALAVIANTGYHDYEGPAFDLEERERLISDLQNLNILILRNHGLLTVGKTVAEAFMWMYRAGWLVVSNCLFRKLVPKHSRYQNQFKRCLLKEREKR